MKLAVIGLGVAGKSVLKNAYIANYTQYYIYDTKFTNDAESEMKNYMKNYGKNCSIQLLNMQNIREMDIICLSAGIDLKHCKDQNIVEMCQIAQKANIPFVNDIELFYKHFSPLTLAITGSYGKSTVASMCSFLLNQMHIKHQFKGNIGSPMWDFFEQGIEIEGAGDNEHTGNNIDEHTGNNISEYVIDNAGDNSSVLQNKQINPECRQLLDDNICLCDKNSMLLPADGRYVRGDCKDSLKEMSCDVCRCDKNSMLPPADVGYVGGDCCDNVLQIDRGYNANKNISADENIDLYDKQKKQELSNNFRCICKKQNLSDKIIVLEVSNNQLELIESMNPEVGIVTNVHEHHLDRYDGDLSVYMGLKKKLLLLSKKKIIGNYSLCTQWHKEFEQEIWIDQKDDLFKLNASYAIEAVYLFIKQLYTDGKYDILTDIKSDLLDYILTDNKQNFIKECLIIFENFNGLKHRQEIFYNKHNIKIINDSKSTDVHPTIASIKRFCSYFKYDKLPNVINILICGGALNEYAMPAWQEIVPFLQNIDILYLFGQAKDSIYSVLQQRKLPVEYDVSIILCQSLEDVIEKLAYNLCHNDKKNHNQTDDFNDYQIQEQNVCLCDNKIGPQSMTMNIKNNSIDQKNNDHHDNMQLRHYNYSQRHAADNKKDDLKSRYVVLFSPGCQSFDAFRNFEHRGECFKNQILSKLNKILPFEQKNNI